MAGNAIEAALKSFGLTAKEAQIYIFLAKRGVQGGGEIAFGTKTAKPVVYRILKILQRKGFAESTLESPVRYTAVPFENVLDSNIRGKHEEARQIENSRKDLLLDWNKISRGQPESPLEKFAVIEGDSNIFAKIVKMVKETKSQLLTIAPVTEILQADRYGIFEAIYNHPLRSSVRFRYITDLSPSDLKSAQFLKRRLKRSIDLRGRNPDLGLRLFPRMVIRDQEEVLFFITPGGKQASLRQEEETCLATNCKAMVQAFSAVFEDLWVNSTDIEKLIDEIVSGNPSQQTRLLKDPAMAKRIYLETLESARDEIIIVTSSRGLIELSHKESEFRKWCKKGASVRIMAPITTENLQPTREMLKWSEIRHFPPGYFDTTIIDSCHLFQFSSPSSEGWSFEDTLYTNNMDYIQKTKSILSNMWETTRTPSFQTVRALSEEFVKPIESRLEGRYLEKQTSFMRSLQLKYNGIKENVILSKIESARAREKKKTKDPVVWSRSLKYFGSRAFAAIHPPKSFALPDMIIGAFHHEEESAFGAENWIVVNLFHENGKRTSYDTVAFVQDNPKPLAFRKKIFAGSTAGSNILTFREDEIEVQAKGKTMFAGWTKPIPLGSKGTLPPSSLLFEGYGEAKPGKFINIVPSGRRQEHWYNGFDAFVTFFHPDSKYVGPGTEGFIQTNSMFISRPPKQQSEN